MRSICADVSSVIEKEVGEDFACMRSSQRSTDTEKDYPIFIFTNYYVYRWRGQNYHSLGAAVGHYSLDQDYLDFIVTSATPPLKHLDIIFYRQTEQTYTFTGSLPQAPPLAPIPPSQGMARDVCSGM